MNRLATIGQVEQAPPERGDQRPRRELEQAIRRQVLEIRRWTAGLGWTRAQTASGLGIRPRTLRHWEQLGRRDQLRARPRGRPLTPADDHRRDQVVALLHALGPGVGLPVLQRRFPDLARAELRDLLRCYRQAWRHAHGRAGHVLHWTRPGSVWTMDFAEPPAPIDGRYPYLLAVRDLASGQQLLWQPVETATAQITIEALTRLFTIHGAPLLLKSDNGSAFLAEEMKRLLQTWKVTALFSPPGTPEYNGACEASIGSLKTRTRYEAALSGCPEIWTSADVEAARQEANATARPRGRHGPTPDQAWDQRQLLTTEERLAFRETVEEETQKEREQEGIPPERSLGHYQQAALDRQAIRRALVAHGFLLFSRRRVPAAIRSAKVTKIM